MIIAYSRRWVVRAAFGSEIRANALSDLALDNGLGSNGCVKLTIWILGGLTTTESRITSSMTCGDRSSILVSHLSRSPVTHVERHSNPTPCRCRNGRALECEVGRVICNAHTSSQRTADSRKVYSRTSSVSRVWEMHHMIRRRARNSFDLQKEEMREELKTARGHKHVVHVRERLLRQ
ncbi:hypothetical protein BKA93DRAFT_573582 [Sparassis latifolia]